MPGRKYNAGTGYRYGFNGKENDNEVKGEGNQQDYGFRIYDPRIGRFLSVDPIAAKYPELTPYQFASNTPIRAIDLDGLEAAMPKVIGTTYAKIKKLTSAEIEENITSLNVTGLSTSFLKALIKEEGLSLSMYDVDNKVEKLNTVGGRGGNATIAWGHLVHYGAIGATQYDRDALTKEAAYTDGKVTLAGAIAILKDDLTTRMTNLNNSLNNNKISDAKQGVVDLFMDLIFNTGNAKNAISIYKKGGVLGLHIALKNTNPKIGQIIKNVSTNRQKMRLELIKTELQDENYKKAMDDPRDTKPKKGNKEVDIALIKLSTGQYVLKINNGKKCYIII